MEQLLTDENAWIRAGAVDVLAQTVRNSESTHAESGTPASSDAKTNAIQLLNTHLAKETSAQVLHSVCQLFMASTFDPKAMGPFIGRAALSNHPDTRKAAMQACRRPRLNEELLVHTAITLMGQSDDHLNEEMLWAAIAVREAKTHPAVRTAIPAVAAHLRNRVNAADPPFRKQAWYQAVDRELGLLESQWNEETEKVADVVPALCRSVVRLPRGRTNSGDLQARAERLLEKCSPASAAVIRKCAREESVWLAGVADTDLLRILNGFSAERLDVAEARAACRDAIEYLKSLAENLNGSEVRAGDGQDQLSK